MNTPVRFQPLSQWQHGKSNCLYCGQPAIQEAAYELGHASSNLRCCGREECMDQAAADAFVATEALFALAHRRRS